jgi:hypothetical protein
MRMMRRRRRRRKDLVGMHARVGFRVFPKKTLKERKKERRKKNCDDQFKISRFQTIL